MFGTKKLAALSVETHNIQPDFHFLNTDSKTRSLEENANCTFPDDGNDYSTCTDLSDADICLIGNGECDAALNTTDCYYDGEDCSTILDAELIFGWICNSCLWLGGSCDFCNFPDDGFDYSSCDVTFPFLVGNEWCNFFLNCEGKSNEHVSVRF